ncbi:two-component system C4-dicarboxylate transport sensor histidine kinase DctB [Neorhizobium galegae]|uniref:sensor histidine kinase n=1 Tax=Neorhizobium galegae TaxID=399 RepID=UPI001AE60A1E|nr:ATP-binding protein [Neorhizobium galegae]MBP2551181.1 two-component system C4-dicarboxylate transport sensor histidine kinase DctB [Neorhizobium galegae]
MEPALSETQDRAPRPRVARRPWLIFTALATACLAVALSLVHHHVSGSVIADLQRQGRVDAGLKVALLRAVLERPRSLPLILAQDRDVEEALSAPAPARLDALNRKLEALITDTNASVLYVINHNGRAIASSNWREPSSFVGSDYAFRAYFSRAITDGAAEHFALGSVSNRPGLYISQRVGPADNPLGVVVVKAEFDQLEEDWRNAVRPSFVTDPNGVVLITSIASWRFMTLAPLPAPKLKALHESLQFGDTPLLPLPVNVLDAPDEDTRLIETVLPGERQALYLEVAVPVGSTAWRLHYLSPVEPALSAAVRQAQLSVLLILVPLLALAALWIWRRQATLARIAMEQAARTELERRVRERTADLTRARDRLEAEITDHRVTEARLQGVQQELVQANRLAILGQVAAGVAHEINQPVATIRAYADNARTFLSRSQLAPAEENLNEIASLTERIGTITEDLKALARKGRSAAEPVSLKDVLNGAVMLLKTRFSGRLDLLKITMPREDLRVLGNQLRLEQVMINLLQNALEAIEQHPEGLVHVDVDEGPTTVLIHVVDTGPGIAPAILDQLFSPFNTSKEGGLGLGLVIAKDIVSDYGGHIRVDSSSEGTRFTIELKRAEP